MFLIKPNKSKTSEERKSEFLQAITIFSICGHMTYNHIISMSGFVP